MQTIDVAKRRHDAGWGGDTFQVRWCIPAINSVADDRHSLLAQRHIANAISQTVQASGGVGPFNWSVSTGTLPHNLVLNNSVTNTTTISGTPDTAAQGVAFTIKVADSASHSATQPYAVSILLEPDALKLTPPSLSFAPQLIGAVSGAQSDTVANTGTSPVVLSGIALTGTNAQDFSQTTACGSSLAAGANCTLNVTFTPSQLGLRGAAITITDNTVGSPHSVSLSGAGLTSGPNATLSGASLTFATQTVGTTSAAQSITLSNYGTMTLNIASTTTTANFGETDNCSSLASGASCTINVTSIPGVTGQYSGTLSVTDNAPGSPQTLALNGSGTTSSATLTGFCWGQTRYSPQQCELVRDLAECPAGQLAITPAIGSCVIGVGSQDTEDTSRVCKWGGAGVNPGQGYCEVK